jgi:hypothetical protein
MSFDAKWLEILKATGWQTGCLSLGFALLLVLIQTGALPDFGGVAKLGAAVACIVCGSLALAAFLGVVAKPTRQMTAAYLRERGIQKRIRDYIPHLTEHEREIFGYLVHKNEKTFLSAADGGYAATLIAQGFIAQTLRPGQVFDPEHVPCIVPDPVWAEVIKHKDQLPKPKRGEPHPWRVSYMLRGGRI